MAISAYSYCGKGVGEGRGVQGSRKRRSAAQGFMKAHTSWQGA